MATPLPCMRCCRKRYGAYFAVVYVCGHLVKGGILNPLSIMKHRPSAGRPGHANLPIGLEKAVRLSETGNSTTTKVLLAMTGDLEERDLVKGLGIKVAVAG